MAMTMPTDMVAFNREAAAQFRANHGEMKDGPLKGMTVMLLTTTGRKSGQPKTVVLGFTRDDDRYVVVGSNNASEEEPQWYRNLLAYGDVTVEVGREMFTARASVAEGEERTRLWRELVSQKPFFKDHQAKLDRQLPVVLLERTG
jgi:deazaflavin-dependent oxidoreductase (nitroreductase family)